VLGARRAGDERAFDGDTRLVLAGAVVHLGGGRIVAGPAPDGGLRFELAFPRAPAPAARDGNQAAVSYSQARADTLRRFERSYLEELMRMTDGNLSAAARRSGIDRSNLRRMLRQLGISYASAAGN
jgi:DNA-binding NtrC family response regulator